MSLRRRRQCVLAQTTWMFGALVLLVSSNLFSLELYYSISFVGFLVIVEVTAPLTVTPSWRRPLRWLVAGGIVGFGYIVGERMLDILADFL